MNSITKISVAYLLALLFVVVGFAAVSGVANNISSIAFTSTAYAFGDPGGGGDCCGDAPGSSDTNGSDRPGGYEPPITTTKTPVCKYLDASKTKVSYGGENVKLTWATKNAKEVRLNGYGVVAKNGSKTVFVDSDTTFKLRAIRGNEKDICTVAITVKDKPEDKQPSCDYFEANPSDVDKNEDFVLRWGTTNADSVTINQGIGSVGDDGSITVSTDEDTTYTLTAKLGSKTVTCSTSVDVTEDHHHDNPRCDLEISDDDIDKGDKVRLSWDNDNAKDIILEDDDGNELINTDDGDDYDPEDDDITVKPREDTEYTLTVYGKDGGRDKCRVDVNVDDNHDDEVYVSKYRDQQPLIALTRVPYTGFDAGPFLTGLFYTLLGLWGAAVAYILVVKKGSIFGFALAGGTAKAATAASFAPSVVSASVATESPVETETAVPSNLPVGAYPEMDTETVDDTSTEAEGEADAEMSMLEERAQESRVLLSSDALNFIKAQAGTFQAQLTFLDMAVHAAKSKYPTEDGWLALNKERLLQLFR